MTTEKTNNEEGKYIEQEIVALETEKKGKDSDLSYTRFIGIIMLLVGAVAMFTTFPEIFSSDGDRVWSLAFLGFFLLGFIEIIGAIGILLHKRYGYYLAWFFAVWNLLLSTMGIGNIIIQAVISALIIYMLSTIGNLLPKRDKTDNKILLGIVVLILGYAFFTPWALSQPTRAQYISMVTNEAIQKNNVTLCDKIEGSNKDDCIKAYAIAKNDSKICELIQWEHLRGYCYGELNSNGT